jgi:hypothetical protein
MKKSSIIGSGSRVNTAIRIVFLCCVIAAFGTVVNVGFFGILSSFSFGSVVYRLATSEQLIQSNQLENPSSKSPAIRVETVEPAGMQYQQPGGAVANNAPGIDRSETRIISFLKNPITKNYELNFYMPEPGAVELVILNASGRKIEGGNMLAKEGYNSFEFPERRNLRSEIFYVNLITEKNKVTLKINNE